MKTNFKQNALAVYQTQNYLGLVRYAFDKLYFGTDSELNVLIESHDIEPYQTDSKIVLTQKLHQIKKLAHKLLKIDTLEMTAGNQARYQQIAACDDLIVDQQQATV